MRSLPEGDAVEETQRADRLVERRPGDAVRHQMDLKRARPRGPAAPVSGQNAG